MPKLKLDFDWQLKGKEIQDKVKYCIAVWVCVGNIASPGAAIDPKQMGKEKYVLDNY